MLFSKNFIFLWRRYNKNIKFYILNIIFWEGSESNKVVLFLDSGNYIANSNFRERKQYFRL